MRICHQKDFASGLLFFGTGLAFAWGARNYDMGTARQMGPGYFAVVLSVILTLIGSLLCLRSIGRKAIAIGDIGRWSLGPVSFIIGSNVIFGILLAGLPELGIPSAGFVPAVIALVIVAAMGSADFKWRTYILLSISLSVTSYLIFVNLLGMQFSAFPAFFSEAVQ